MEPSDKSRAVSNCIRIRIGRKTVWYDQSGMSWFQSEEGGQSDGGGMTFCLTANLHRR